MSNPASNPSHPHVWRDVARVDPPRRSAAERIADFLEIHGAYDEDAAREQASRCLQCPEPVCVAGCPLHSNIPEWLRLTAEGQFLEAAGLLHGTSNLPEITTSVCPPDHTCECMCILEGRSEAVSIGAIEHFLNSYALNHGGEEMTPAAPNGQRVAILGSGPGGLTAADELARRGYAVTVFDSELIPGGLLVNGIPAFKLDKSIVQRRIGILRARGVQFRMGVCVGIDVSFAQLRSEFDAFYLAFRSRQARELSIPGAGLTGVVQALPFVVDKNTNVPLDLPHVDVAGKRVVVVGGGALALDCARTAVRAGAAATTCVYRRDVASMPCGRRDYDDAVEEGVVFVLQTQPIAVLEEPTAGKARGLRLVKTDLGAAVDADGRPTPTAVAGSEFDLEADLVFLALGFDPLPLPHVEPYDHVATTGDGRIAVDERMMTSLPDVFAGGDMVRGPAPVLWAVRDARRAAEAIDAHLAAKRKK